MCPEQRRECSEHGEGEAQRGIGKDAKGLVCSHGLICSHGSAYVCGIGVVDTL